MEWSLLSAGKNQSWDVEHPKINNFHRNSHSGVLTRDSCRAGN